MTQNLEYIDSNNVNPDNIDNYIKLTKNAMSSIEEEEEEYKNNIENLLTIKKDYLQIKHLKGSINDRPLVNENILIGTVYFITI